MKVNSVVSGTSASVLVVNLSLGLSTPKTGGSRGEGKFVEGAGDWERPGTAGVGEK